MPTQGVTRGQDNVLNALLIAQSKRETGKVKTQLQQLTQEHKKISNEFQKTQKKYSDLEKQHKEAKKELHKYKLQYDGNYAFENKQVKKEAMQKARDAKAKKRKVITTKSKEARQAARIKTRTRK